MTLIYSFMAQSHSLSIHYIFFQQAIRRTGKTCIQPALLLYCIVCVVGGKETYSTLYTNFPHNVSPNKHLQLNEPDLRYRFESFGSLHSADGMATSAMHFSSFVYVRITDSIYGNTKMTPEVYQRDQSMHTYLLLACNPIATLTHARHSCTPINGLILIRVAVLHSISPIGLLKQCGSIYQDGIGVEILPPF